MTGSLHALTPELTEGLRGRLDYACFRELGEQYLGEPRGMWHATDGVVLAPSNVDEAAVILKFAHENRIAVVPYSGGTGLVGGQIAPGLPRPIILSSERLNSVRQVLPIENVMVAEAGVILQNARLAADEAERLFPLLLASEGSCRLGGNLATNAGGMNVLRYGNTRDLCLGIEAVLPGGKVFSGLKRLRKDNTGYDLRNLLIGSEGTLGFITAASLRLFPKPQHRSVALLEVSSPDAALDLLEIAGDEAGGMVSVFELISGVGFQMISETLPGIHIPFAHVPEWSVLVEVATPARISSEMLIEGILEKGTQAGLIMDGYLAQSQKQAENFFGLREMIPEANKRVGSIASHDISLPLSVIPEFIKLGAEKLSELGPLRLNCFGHLGDGNLHFNLFPPKNEAKSDWLHLRPEVTDVVHDLVAEYDGSFSAEHGVGRLKVGELAKYGDKGRLEAMKSIKMALDPNGIMNPGVLF